MSSSKSVAAARARRATEPPSNQRPRTSIGSFSQVPPSFQPQPTQRNNSRMSQQPMQQFQQQQLPQQPKPKISIGNAIALLSLRLGRLEQHLQENSDGSSISVLANSGENNSSIHSEAFTSIMNRLVLLENKPYIDKQSNDDYLLKLSRENKEIKDNLQMIVKTFNNFTKEANDKFLDYEAAFVDIENKLKAFIEENTEEEPFEGELMENDHELSTDDVSSTILSEEIKNEIRNI
jgi:hypothetical protein